MNLIVGAAYILRGWMGAPNSNGLYAVFKIESFKYSLTALFNLLRGILVRCQKIDKFFLATICIHG